MIILLLIMLVMEFYNNVSLLLYCNDWLILIDFCWFLDLSGFWLFMWLWSSFWFAFGWGLFVLKILLGCFFMGRGWKGTLRELLFFLKVVHVLYNFLCLKYLKNFYFLFFMKVPLYWYYFAWLKSSIYFFFLFLTNPANFQPNFTF